MLRLATQLDIERQGKQSLRVEDTESETSFNTAIEDHENLFDGREKLEGSVSLPPIEDPQFAQQGSLSKKKKTRSKKIKDSSGAPDSRFHTKNIFDSLRELHVNAESEKEASSSSEEEPLVSRSNGISLAEGDGSATEDAWQNETYKPDTSTWVPIETVKCKPMELIPAFDSAFWKDFGNTLRIFGTQEAVLKIAEWEK